MSRSSSDRRAISFFGRHPRCNGTGNGVRGTQAPTTGFTSATGGDGTSVVTLLSENDPNLLRIEIFWNGKSVARALRSAPVEGT